MKACMDPLETDSELSHQRLTQHDDAWDLAF